MESVTFKGCRHTKYGSRDDLCDADAVSTVHVKTRTLDAIVPVCKQHLAEHQQRAAKQRKTAARRRG